MKSIFTAAVLAVGAMTFVGCSSSHQEGVKSNLHSQWVMVTADTVATTDAAKAVLEEAGLKEVTAKSTMVDGTAMGKKADGTPVKVMVNKKDTGTEVNVTVGTMGDPTLGADIAKKIELKLAAK